MNAVRFDFQKAFDVVQQDVLINKFQALNLDYLMDYKRDHEHIPM